MKIHPIHKEAVGSLSRCLLSQSRLLLNCYYTFMWHIVGCYIGKWVWVNSSKQEVAPSVLAMNIWNSDFPEWKEIFLHGFWSVSQEYDRYFTARQTPSLCLRNILGKQQWAGIVNQGGIVLRMGKNNSKLWIRDSWHAGFILSLELSAKAHCSTSTVCCSTPFHDITCQNTVLAGKCWDLTPRSMGMLTENNDIIFQSSVIMSHNLSLSEYARSYAFHILPCNQHILSCLP